MYEFFRKKILLQLYQLSWGNPWNEIIYSDVQFLCSSQLNKKKINQLIISIYITFLININTLKCTLLIIR